MAETSLVTHKVGNALIGQRVTDGYINATILCQACGRELSTYLRSQDTSLFLDELSRSLQICRDLLIQKTGTGANDRRGTWVHPRVAIHLAQWCSPKFAVLVTQWVYEWMTTGQVNASQTQNSATLPVYTKRLALTWKMQVGVPDGYWTVFDKCSNLLILVECDLKMPVEKYDLLDGSVGIHWKNFRKDKSWTGERQQYRHIFPDKRGIQLAWAYPLQELAHFDRWMRGVYIPLHLPTYLDTKYKLPVPASRLLAKVLGPSRLLPPLN